MRTSSAAPSEEEEEDDGVGLVSIAGGASWLQ